MSDEHAVAGEDRGSEASSQNDRGPQGDVPEHVDQIHETINQFLGGEIDDLGHALSDLLGGEDTGDADEQSDDTDTESDDADDTGVDGDADTTGEVGDEDENDA